MGDLTLDDFNNLDNADLLNAIRDFSSNTYQDRIPFADKADISDTIANLLNYRPSMNEFLGNLVNVIGSQIYVEANAFTNPLAKFKRAALMYGDTIEEIMNGLLEAHRYNPQAEYLEEEIFGTEKPETQANYHKINRKDYYKLTIKPNELRKAFTQEFGLSQFITGLMSIPQKSDQWDEFLLTASLFKEWHKYGGYFNINVPDISAQSSDSADSKYTLRRLRETADTLPFLSRRYNPAHLPMSAAKNELELIITPEANAAMDVEALAGAFNIDRAQFDVRRTVIPSEYIGIDGFQAMLTTDKFFVIADSVTESRTAENPVGLHTNWFLHRQGVVSASRFAPAVLLTSAEPSTEIITIQTPVVDVLTPTFRDAGGETVTDLERGFTYQVVSEAITSPTGGDNNAVRLELVGAQSTRTRIWQSGMLAVAIDELADELTINLIAVDDESIIKTATVDVVGEYAQLWPNAQVLTDTDDDDILEITPVAPTPDEDKHIVFIPTVGHLQYKNNGTNVKGGNTVDYSTVTAVITAVAKTGYELKPGETATWTYVHP